MALMDGVLTSREMEYSSCSLCSAEFLVVAKPAQKKRFVIRNTWHFSLKTGSKPNRFLEHLNELKFYE